MSEYLLISDAAKEVQVESHVLRYWEEELHLPIKRNELGHRYYTMEDVERFKQIKSMKERGLQLKAIKMILKDGKLDVIPENDVTVPAETVPEKQTDNDMMLQTQIASENAEDKARRLQWLLKQLIRETLEENNRELCREIRENVVKELDYQFRAQEERDDERERKLSERNEEYYKKMDELLRNKSTAKKIKGGKRRNAKKEEMYGQASEQAPLKTQADKKKRHSIL
jgi:DNA-binding transcriptional MerR regulator